MGSPGRAAVMLITVGLTLLLAPNQAATARLAATTWPGDQAVSVADQSDLFGENLSGVSFQDRNVLWAVKNGPGTLYRLVPDGGKWRPDPAGGTKLHYPNGDGDPDAEGVVATAEGIFAATERDNDDKNHSKQEIVRFDASGAATAQWNLTADLPKSDPNEGIEGISWIPDSFLTGHGFRDTHSGKAYDPAVYPGHGTGLYFVGLESNGSIYAYALNQVGGTYTRVATAKTGFEAVMDLAFDPATGHLWAVCDDTCDGRSATLDINAQGALAASGAYNRPGKMPNYNNEGFAIAPPDSCTAGRKTVIWTDDSNDDNHALRSGTLFC